MTIGRRQLREFVRLHPDPGSLPVGCFTIATGGKVACVLCGRDGYGSLAFDPDRTFPTRPRGHRVLLAWTDDDSLVQVEGPDTAPLPPRAMPWWCQFSPWQIGCMWDHPWPCVCGRRFPSYVNLWRHIGADRPRGWGRQEPPEHRLVPACEWPRNVA